MAEGSSVSCAAQQRPVSLDEAIRRLEAGHDDALEIDLGQGRIARIQGPRGREGLLQRLRAHSRLAALAAGEGDVQRLAPELRPLQIAPEVKDILRAITSRPRPPTE
jgi:hypothetical protein